MDERFQRRDFLAATAAAGTALMLPGLARATQGVSRNEILIGTLPDLSGPVVSLGKGILNGMVFRAEQLNALGGIHGRKIRVIAEDTAYDPKKGVLGAQKLLSQDKIFAMIGSVGTGVSLPTIPMCIEHNVPHMFPISAHKGNYEPLHKLKFASFMPYQSSAELALKTLVTQRGYKRVGILYQDDEFGMEVMRGAEKGLAKMNMKLVEVTSFKRGATEFSSQIQKLRAANADLILLASIVRETIGAMATARQGGYGADFVTIAAVPAVAKAGGKAVEGLIATSEVTNIYRDDPGNSKALNEWIDQFQARFKEAPDVWNVLGWMFVDIFSKAAEQAGPNLTTEAFVDRLENLTYGRTFLGTPEYKWTPTNHQGNYLTRLHQIRNGRWTPITDFMSI